MVLLPNAAGLLPEPWFFQRPTVYSCRDFVKDPKYPVRIVEVVYAVPGQERRTTYRFHYAPYKQDLLMRITDEEDVITRPPWVSFELWTSLCDPGEEFIYLDRVPTSGPALSHTRFRKLLQCYEAEGDRFDPVALKRDYESYLRLAAATGMRPQQSIQESVEKLLGSEEKNTEPGPISLALGMA